MLIDLISLTVFFLLFCFYVIKAHPFCSSQASTIRYCEKIEKKKFDYCDSSPITVLLFSLHDFIIQNIFLKSQCVYHWANLFTAFSFPTWNAPLPFSIQYVDILVKNKSCFSVFSAPLQTWLQRSFSEVLFVQGSLYKSTSPNEPTKFSTISLGVWLRWEVCVCIVGLQESGKKRETKI